MSEYGGTAVQSSATDAELGALLDYWTAQLAAENAFDADADGLEPWQFDDAGLLAELGRVQRQRSGLAARWLKLLAEAEARQATVRRASLPTAGWLVDGNTHSARSARDEVQLAAGLAAQPVVAQALTSGQVSVEQAQVIVRGLGRLPAELSMTQVAEVAADLVARAADFGPAGLARLVNRAVEVIAPEVAEEADRCAVERLDAEQRRDRYFSWRQDFDGAWLFQGKLGTVAGQQLISVLRSLVAGQSSAAALVGVELSRGQATADALVVLAEHFAGCQSLPTVGGECARVTVNIDYDVLCGKLGTATLINTETGNTDTPITAQEARRIACDAMLLPIVLNGNSEPLDVGREKRLFSSTLRQVPINRDRGCAFPGCDRGPAECEGHHILSWRAGGETSLRNGVLLCTYHHHLVEPDPNAPPDSQWQIQLDAHGDPEFDSPVGRGAPPGQRRWRQHHRYRT